MAPPSQRREGGVRPVQDGPIRSTDGSEPVPSLRIALQLIGEVPVQPNRRVVRMSLDVVDGATDLDLVLRARAGDGRAFAQLLRRHGAAMRAVALRTTRNAADADDAVQEAAVHVWRDLGSLRDPAKARSWMLRITAREAVRRVVGSQQEHELTDDSAAVAGPDHGVDRFDLHAGLRSGLRALPEPQARAWLLREAHGLSYREIAERLDASESTVRGWLVLARKRIQRSIDECCPTARPRAVSVRLPIGGGAPPVVQPEPTPVATAPRRTAPPTARG